MKADIRTLPERFSPGSVSENHGPAGCPVIATGVGYGASSKRLSLHSTLNGCTSENAVVNFGNVFGVIRMASAVNHSEVQR